jgi:hypothetical protein
VRGSRPLGEYHGRGVCPLCGTAGICTPATHVAPSNSLATPTDCNADHPDRGNHPANCVTYTQARDYCAWKGLRLPSAAEWEYAARGHDYRRFPWGNARPDATRLNVCAQECSRRCGADPSCEKRAMSRGSDGYAATAPSPGGAGWPFGAEALGSAGEGGRSPRRHTRSRAAEINDRSHQGRSRPRIPRPLPTQPNSADVTHSVVPVVAVTMQH